MKHVLYVGLDPELVELDDESLPQGITSEKIRVDISVAMAQMSARSWRATFCGITDDPEEALARVEVGIASGPDCIVIGSGIRCLGSQVLTFEKIVNYLRSRAPSTPIAFNSSPLDTANAAARWIAE